MLPDWYRNFGKRLFDLVLVVPALIMFTPVMALVALLVRHKLGTSVLFRQQRPGLYGQPFTILKFRTMLNAYDSRGFLLPDGDRLTSLGGILRRTSLDELPELFNVFKGEMSLVGPRPLRMRYLNRYDPEQIRRHEVKPGLTGWAQVNGRNTLNWDERLKLDTWYVDHKSLYLDLKIILMTIWTVFKREGISHPGHVTMADFKGNTPNGLHFESRKMWQEHYDAARQKRNQIPSEQRTFSPDLKAQAVLEVITGVRRAVEICREYGIDRYTLARWQGDFLENVTKVFESNE